MTATHTGKVEDALIRSFAIAAKMGDACFESSDPSLHRALQASKQRIADGLRAVLAHDALAEAIHREIMAELFALCQPDKGDIFGFMDDHFDVIQTALRRAVIIDPVAS